MHPSNTWLASQYKSIREFCEANGTHPWDVLEQLESGALDLGRTGEIVNRFVTIKESLTQCDGLTVEQLIDRLFPDGQEWTQVFREMAILAIADLKTAADLLNHLRTKITQPEMPDAGAFVRIMSLHKSKGLTSRAVIVCGCIEGLVPFRDDDEPPAVQANLLREQRRLLYVAITRCTQFLAVSSFLRIETKTAYKIGARTAGRGKIVNTIASQFLGEFGPSAPAAVHGNDLLNAL